MSCKQFILPLQLDKDAASYMKENQGIPIYCACVMNEFCSVYMQMQLIKKVDNQFCHSNKFHVISNAKPRFKNGILHLR